MARIYSLYSSSQGNATFIGTEKGGILIDAGVTCKKLVEGLGRNNIPLSAVQGIFVTHSHGDHVKGLRVFTGKTGCRIYGQGETLREIIDRELVAPKSQLIEIKSKVECGGMEISAFNTPHDTAGSCGYRIHTGDGKICAVCTDLGHITSEVRAGLSGCRLVLLESNYDENMLRQGGYPLHLKQRILSDKGHLSNTDSSVIARELVESGTVHIVLGHLSQENNRPEIAEKTAVNGLSGLKRNIDYLLNVAEVEGSRGAIVF